MDDRDIPATNHNHKRMYQSNLNESQGEKPVVRARGREQRATLPQPRHRIRVRVRVRAKVLTQRIARAAPVMAGHGLLRRPPDASGMFDAFVIVQFARSLAYTCCFLATPLWWSGPVQPATAPEVR